MNGGKFPKNYDYIGEKPDRLKSSPPPKKSREPKYVKPKSYLSGGESEATSLKAARNPTHWRRGGFVTRGK
jgi:hypothetical protein